MFRPIPFHPERRPLAALRHPLVLAGCAALVALAWILGCREMSLSPAAAADAGSPPSAGGEEFFLSAIEAIEEITDPSAGALLERGAFAKRPLRATAADTTYVYGEVTPQGYGAVVTERHAYPKGILLITVRRSYGTSASHLVTETRRYTSDAAFLADSAEQTNVTEVYGLSADTIVTHVDRNGLVETYTFRLPVVTRVTNPADGSVRVTTRYADAGAVISEVRDGAGLLVSRRLSTGAADGAIISTISYADSTWRSTRTVGQADGSVLRDVTSGP
jgi:hypothetical protein